MGASKQSILRKYSLSTEDVLHKGMEAEVYALGNDALLKLYIQTTTFAHLKVLQEFYASIDASGLSYSLPSIQSIAEEDGICISIERRLPGIPMSTVLSSLTTREMEKMMQSSLVAALELGKVRIPSDFDRYRLFDAEGLSDRIDGDWYQFLDRLLTYELTQVRSYLERDVLDFSAKLAQLSAILAQPYTGDYQLVHGDFFPGNLLVNEKRQVTALFDFGLLTMYGDYLFDIATGWVFFDMYDELKANLRERYFSIILEALGEGVRGRLYRYVLLYSILGANAYSPTCSDGHYQWCVANLNNREYWKQTE